MFTNSVRNGINSFNPHKKKLSGKALAGKNVKKLWSKEHAQLTHDHSTKCHSQDSNQGASFLSLLCLSGVSPAERTWTFLTTCYSQLAEFMA